MKTAKIVERLPKHFLTMINFNWECMGCGKEQNSSLSEEEDLAQQSVIIETCRNCRYNNRIQVSEIYSDEKPLNINQP